MLISDTHSAGRTAAVTISLDELIPQDHLIRKIDAAIRWEERCAPLRDCYRTDRGRPAFEPDILLAVALLRHIYHIDSLRAIGAELQTNLIYRWFIGCALDESVPHFSTISANMLHRIPKDIFEECFAGALRDILDAGVLPPADIVYESPFLTKGGWLEILASQYFVLVDQLSLIPPEKKDGEAHTQISFE